MNTVQRDRINALTSLSDLGDVFYRRVLRRDSADISRHCFVVLLQCNASERMSFDIGVAKTEQYISPRDWTPRENRWLCVLSSRTKIEPDEG